MADLMTPRWIVENLWPDCKFNEGDILIRHYSIPDHIYTPDKHGRAYAMHGMKESEAVKFPYLIRELGWHEMRHKKDLPEYVSTIGKNHYFKVLEHLEDGQFVIENDDHTTGNLMNFLPATLADYQSFIKTK